MPHKSGATRLAPLDPYTVCALDWEGNNVARGKHITEYERETIRIGLAHGVPIKQIAAFLGRTERVIYQQRDKMEGDGSLHALPFPFVAKPMAEAMKRHEVKK